MIDKKEYPELYKATEETIQSRLRWLTGAIQCQVICESLPKEIKSMKITSADYGSGGLSLNITAEKDTIKTLKILGIKGLKPQVASWSKERFYSQGEGILPNGDKLNIVVSDIDRPEGCRVEEKTITRTENVLVCEQTGETLS